MPYLGNEPAVAYTSTTKDTFSGDASTTDFTLSKSANVNAVRVVVENVVQNPTVAYTCSGTTLSFTSAPPTGTNNIYVVHLGPPAATIAPPTTINNATTFTGGVTLKNETPEDTDGGRESIVTFQGTQSGSEISTLAQIQASHDGTSDDQAGDLIFKTNDGSDGASPTEAMRIQSDQKIGIGTSSPSHLIDAQLSGTSSGEVISVGNIGTGSFGGIAVSDGGTYPVRHWGSSLEFYTGNSAYGSASKRMTILSDGSVGINGTPDSGRKLHIEGGDASVGITLKDTAGGQFGINNDGGFLIFKSDTAGSERMFLSPNGNFLLGTAYDGFNTRLNVRFAGSGAETTGISLWTAGSSGVKFIQFVGSSGSEIGTITQNGTSAVAYNTSSDYRLKENITDVTDGITRVKQLEPKRFNFIDDPDRTVDGFIAHEAQLVVPEAITGTKDAMRDEEYEVSAATGDIYTPATEEAEEVIHSSNVEKPETLEDGQQWRETKEAVMGTRTVPDYQGIDQSKIVPLLTAALREAIAKIETLETKVAALEAG